MIPGYSEELRLTYPLTPDSVVIDAGGYKGDWAAEINRRYGCKIHIYEPILAYFERIAARFSGEPNIIIRHAGLWDKKDTAKFGIQNDSTGRFSGSEVRETVDLLDASEEVAGLGEVALFKLNIEGSEFPVVERLIASGMLGRVQNLQVQWHTCAPNAQARYDALQVELANTHELTFDSQWVWQSWRKT